MIIMILYIMFLNVSRLLALWTYNHEQGFVLQYNNNK